MIFSIPFLVLLLATGCSDNGEPSTPLTQDVSLQMKATFGDEPLVLFQEYNYPAQMKVLFQLFQFYLSEIELVRSDGTVHRLSDIELVRFEDTQNEASGRAGISLTFEDVPAGAYSKLRFGLGVDPDLNKTTPGDYLPGHPLSDNYWSAAKGYIHSKIEGRSDTLSGAGFDNGITFHTGSDELYTILEFPVNLTIDNSLPDPLVLETDLQRILIEPNGNFLDFRQSSVDHHVNPAVYEFIGANFAVAFENEN